MAELTFDKLDQAGVKVLTDVTLTASDTVTLPATGKAFIMVTGTADGTLTLTGEGMPKSVNVAGYGTASFANLSIALTANVPVIMPLSPHTQILQGTITIAGDEGAKAQLFYM